MAAGLKAKCHSSLKPKAHNSFRTPFPHPLTLLLLPLLLAALLIPTPSLSLSALAQFPIPPNYDGFDFSGHPERPPVVLEAFFDLTCPGCSGAWPEVKKLAGEYSSRQLRIVVHPFAAPFHHNSFFTARAMHALAAVNASLAYPWMEAVFEAQDAFSTEATWHTTPEAVVRQLAGLAEEKLASVSAGLFFSQFYQPKFDLLTRISFKYACSRAVVQTPTFLVNGVYVPDADDSWTLNDWKALLNPIIFADEEQKIASPSDSDEGKAFSA